MPRIRAAMAGIEAESFLEQRLRVREIAAARVDVGEEDEGVGGVRRVVQREIELADGGVEFAAIGGADAAQDVRADEVRRGGIGRQFRQCRGRARVAERCEDQRGILADANRWIVDERCDGVRRLARVRVAEGFDETGAGDVARIVEQRRR